LAGPELTSPRSARVSAARRLAKRAFRARERLFLAEGPQAVREALSADGVVTELFVAPEAGERYADLVEAARASGARISTATDGVIAALTQTVTPPGLIAVCRFVDVPLTSAVDASPRLLTVLANVRDPGNAGTVIRTADAAGSDGVVLADASVDPYNAKCVRATAGSLFHLPVVAGAPFVDVVAAAGAAGLQVLAADGAGEDDLDALIDDGTLAAPTAWVFGNEAWGLPEELRAQCDRVVRVPIHGQAESLNLATAAAVCLYASARAQRR
jgi:TrmH family RNA methyltransferase